MISNYDESQDPHHINTWSWCMFSDQPYHITWVACTATQLVHQIAGVWQQSHQHDVHLQQRHTCGWFLARNIDHAFTRTTLLEGLDYAPFCHMWVYTCTVRAGVPRSILPEFRKTFRTAVQFEIKSQVDSASLVTHSPRRTRTACDQNQPSTGIRLFLAFVKTL